MKIFALFLLAATAVAQLVEFDMTAGVTAGAIRLTCSTRFPGVCDVIGKLGAYAVQGANVNLDQITFLTPSDFLVAQSCLTDTCSVACDPTCGCETGNGTGAGFVPDGLCEELGTQPPRPTDAPTFDPDQQVKFDATDAISSKFTCEDDNARCFASGSFQASVNTDAFATWDRGNGVWTVLNSTEAFLILSSCQGDICTVSCDSVCDCKILDTANQEIGDCPLFVSYPPTAAPTVITMEPTSTPGTPSGSNSSWNEAHFLTLMALGIVAMLNSLP